MKNTFGVCASLILLVLIAMVPICAVVVRTSISEQDEALEQASTSLRTQARLRAHSQEQLFESVRHMLTAMAHAAPVRSGNPLECGEYLRDLAEHFSQYAHLGLADAQGRLVCRSVSDPRPIEVGDRPYFRDALRSGRFTVGQYMVSRLLDVPSIAFGLPVFRPGGELQGLLYAVLDLTALQAQFGTLSVPPGMVELISDADGTVLASTGGRMPRAGERLPEGFLLQAVRNGRPVLGKALDQRGQEWLHAVQLVRAEGAGALAVVTMMSSDSVLHPAIRRLQLHLAVLLLIAVAASLAAWQTGNRLLVLPIKRLLAKIKALERGDGAALRAAAAGGGGRVNELRQIDQGIDDLAAALAARSSERDMALAEIREQKKALERSEQRYRAQFEASPQPMWVFDSETLAFLAVNDAAVAHYGYSPEEFMKMTLADIRPPEDIPFLLETLEKTGSRPHNAIVGARHRRKNGDIIDVELSTQTLDWEGRPARAVIVYDVTSRVLAEQAWHRLQETLAQEVAQRTRELELANEELEAFTYSVSHDLRSPLHVIDGFCAALLEKYHGRLPPQGRHYLDRIRAATLQMKTLIADLLSFAQTNRVPVVGREVDLAALAADVVAQLRQRFPERQVRVDIEQPLPVFGDPGLLAIVHRVVHRHGGRVWAESEVGRGARFYISLPD